jgi:thioredoxin 1
MRPLILLLALIAGLAIARPGRAEYVHTEEFDHAAFAAAQSAGRAIVLAIGASWCPVCSRQGAQLTHLSADPAYRHVLILHVDYDTQRDLARSLKAQEQGTLIAYRGAGEITRVIGVVDEAGLRAFLNRLKD